MVKINKENCLKYKQFIKIFNVLLYKFQTLTIRSPKILLKTVKNTIWMKHKWKIFSNTSSKLSTIMSSIETLILLISWETLVKISEWDLYYLNKWLLKDFKVKKDCPLLNSPTVWCKAMISVNFIKAKIVFYKLVEVINGETF